MWVSLLLAALVPPYAHPGIGTVVSTYRHRRLVSCIWLMRVHPGSHRKKCCLFGYPSLDFHTSLLPSRYWQQVASMQPALRPAYIYIHRCLFLFVKTRCLSRPPYPNMSKASHLYHSPASHPC
ncbi:hypothetical protein F4803DRAFT_114251 [Xylaria telfairii]|nr:hypothetical protein F4803DRAFT_114251 [Xylaria telfairii]